MTERPINIDLDPIVHKLAIKQRALILEMLLFLKGIEWLDLGGTCKNCPECGQASAFTHHDPGCKLADLLGKITEIQKIEEEMLG